MIKSVLVSPFSKKALHVEQTLRPTVDLTGQEIVPVTFSLYASHGTFKSVERTSTGTSTIVSPNSNGSIVLTDIFITSNKVANAVVTVQFTDGTNTVTIIKPDITDAPVAMGASLSGRWEGWRDARIDMVIAGGTGHSVTVSCGYVKLPVSIPYAEWDARR